MFFSAHASTSFFMAASPVGTQWSHSAEAQLAGRAGGADMHQRQSGCRRAQLQRSDGETLVLLSVMTKGSLCGLGSPAVIVIVEHRRTLTAAQRHPYAIVSIGRIAPEGDRQSLRSGQPGI